MALTGFNERRSESGTLYVAVTLLQVVPAGAMMLSGMLELAAERTAHRSIHKALILPPLLRNRLSNREAFRL